MAPMPLSPKNIFISLIGKRTYIRYIMFLADLYRSAFLPFKTKGRGIIQRHLIPTGGTVFDIGAHTGRFTALVAPLVGKTGKVYSFEPAPHVLRVLNWVVKIRRFRQVRVVEAALSNNSGESTMTIPLKDGWKPLVMLAHLGGQKVPNSQQIAIKVKQLDEFCRDEDIGPVDFIKCDTEGCEYFVFSGAKNLLSYHYPTIFCEIEEPYLKRQGVKPSDLFNLFFDLGYASYLPTHGDKLTPVSGYQQRGDYLFIHPSRFPAGLSTAEPIETLKL